MSDQREIFRSSSNIGFGGRFAPIELPKLAGKGGKTTTWIVGDGGKIIFESDGEIVLGLGSNLTFKSAGEDEIGGSELNLLSWKSDLFPDDFITFLGAAFYDAGEDENQQTMQIHASQSLDVDTSFFQVRNWNQITLSNNFPSSFDQLIQMQEDLIYLRNSVGGVLIDCDLFTNTDDQFQIGSSGTRWKTIYQGTGKHSFRSTTQYIESPAADKLTISAPEGVRFTEGVRIGTDSTDNLIDEASNGAGSATLYIGNKTIDTSVSDERVKNRREFTSSQYRDVLKLDVFDYTFKPDYDDDSETIHVGVSAQAAGSVNPTFAIPAKNERDLWKTSNQDILFALVKLVQDHERRLDGAGA